MKCSSIAAVALLMAASGSAQDAKKHCRAGLTYCGSTLIGLAPYRERIAQSFRDSNVYMPDEGRNDLWRCGGGRYGTIDYIGYCRAGCANNGPFKNDTCILPTTTPY
ncbi:hypothetical protein GQ53DRAFT_773791 [Thozetella sp. PMI_491]|nr:hypothetical protein GQ53DRAFT_773791 [Thozetella sp. PMI_491]